MAGLDLDAGTAQELAGPDHGFDIPLPGDSMMEDRPGGDDDGAGLHPPPPGLLTHSDAALLYCGAEAFLPGSQSAAGQDDDLRSSTSAIQVSEQTGQ